MLGFRQRVVLKGKDDHLALFGYRNQACYHALWCCVQRVWNLFKVTLSCVHFLIPQRVNFAHQFLSSRSVTSNGDSATLFLADVELVKIPFDQKLQSFNSERIHLSCQGIISGMLEWWAWLRLPCGCDCGCGCYSSRNLWGFPWNCHIFPSLKHQRHNYGLCWRKILTRNITRRQNLTTFQ